MRSIRSTSAFHVTLQRATYPMAPRITVVDMSELAQVSSLYFAEKEVGNSAHPFHHFPACYQYRLKHDGALPSREALARRHGMRGNSSRRRSSAQAPISQERPPKITPSRYTAAAQEMAARPCKDREELAVPDVKADCSVCEAPVDIQFRTAVVNGVEGVLCRGKSAK